jgi:adenylosuccinate synthase
MSTLVIVGAQWGDEAKGKIVDVLGHEADFVVRFSGGNNAGHTVIVGDQTFKFHLLPAGILHRGTTAVLGGGMVVCPKSLLEELDRLRASRPEHGELLISGAAHVVFPYHRRLDALEECARGPNKIGTTSRGIGPAYQDKVARTGIRMGELVRPEVFERRLREVLGVKNRLMKLFGEPPMGYDEMLEEYRAYAGRLRPFVRETDRVLQAAVAKGQRVLFEGAQGTFLDLDAGTYPYVTSSHPVAGGACLGTGVGPRYIDGVLGVAKAYTTRVGSGPLPTELHDATGERIREQGQEYGTTTGRSRRCGWLDLVALRQSCRTNSLSGLIITRLDVLSGIDPLRLCVAYHASGERFDHVPSEVEVLAAVEPEYVQLEGWTGDLQAARRMEDLPHSARRYLEFIESFTSTPVAILSIGPDREETIVLRRDLIWAR